MSAQTRFAKKAEKNGWPMDRDAYKVELAGRGGVGVLVHSGFTGTSANIGNDHRANVLIKETGEPVYEAKGFTAKQAWKIAQAWIDKRLT